MKFLSLFLLVCVPVSLSARHIDTRDISIERAKVQALLSTKRSTGGDAGAEAAAAAALGIGTGLVIASAFTPRYYYRPYGYRYGYGRRGYVAYSGAGAALGFAGGALMAAGAMASASSERQRQDNLQYNASIEGKIAEIIYTLVQSDQDYIAEAQTLNAKLSNRGESLAAELEKQALAEIANLEAPSNQMETRFQEDLAALEARGLATKAYNKQLKKLNKKAAKERKYYLKALRPFKQAVIQSRQETYNAFIESANQEINGLSQSYFRQYHAKLI